MTLEPCNHQGRTPPCSRRADRRRRRARRRGDGRPQSDGGAGRGALRAAGIEVDLGLLEAEARELNIGFVSRITRGRPWVRLKAAASLDGRTALANGESQWITGEAARADGHRWRARACAVLTGIGTVRDDDPELTVRAVATTRQPRRVVVDRHGETPPTAKVLAGAGRAGGHRRRAQSGLAAGDRGAGAAGRCRARRPRGADARRWRTPAATSCTSRPARRLNGALIAAGLVDELLLYVAPCAAGRPGARHRDLRRRARVAWTGACGCDFTGVERIGDDLRILARVRREEG